MKFGSNSVGFMLLGGHDILGVQTQFTDKIEALVEESHGLGSSWQETDYVGIKRYELTQDGFYDDAAHGAHAALESGLSSGRVLVYNVEGNTSGRSFVGVQSIAQIDYNRSPVRGELTKAQANYRGSGLVEQGRIIRPLAGATASGNTTANAHDFGASNPNGGAGYLAISSLVGATATGLQVDILHSDDNLTFSSYIGFAAVSATTPSAQRISSTAARQRYAAARWTGGTGFPTSAVFMVGLTS